MRHPHEIVPRDDKDEVLVAIFDMLVEIRDALTPAASEPPAAEPAEPVAEVVPEPAPAAAPRAQRTSPKKITARKKAAVKGAARKKKAT